MRTKTLLLIAAAVAAGAVTSMAQVFSVNAVGYVNKTVPAGFAIVGNPLNAPTNSINALFQPVPDGFQVYYFVATGQTPPAGLKVGYNVGTFDSLSGGFTPDPVGNATLNPGQAVFVKNPGTTPVTITFVGEVPQGTLTTPLVAGLQLVASQVPQAGTAKDLGFPATVAGGAQDGDQIYQFITNDPTPANNQKYYVSTFDSLSDAFAPDLKSLDVGEGFFLKRTAAGSWTRTFNVNSP